MSARAALLIDWDNVKASFIESDLGCYVTDDPEPFLKRLIEKAEADAKAWSPTPHKLTYTGIAGAPAALSSLTATLARLPRLDSLPASAAKQAADIRLACEAFRLLYKEEYSLFFIVAADVDYIQVANLLSRGEAKTVMWLVQKERLSPETRRYDPQVFVVDHLALDPCPEPKIDELMIFGLSCQRLIDEGKNVHGFERTKNELKERLPKVDIDSLWKVAEETGWLIGRGIHRRVGYETRKVLRCLTLTEYVLQRVGRSKDGVRNEELAQILSQHPLYGEKEFGQLPELMVRARYLRRLGGKYIPVDAPGLTSLGPIRWIAHTVWSIQNERGWKVVSPGVVARSWPRYRLRGAKASQARWKELEDEGRRAGYRGTAAGVVRFEKETVEGRDRPRGGLVAEEFHPITQGVIEACEGLIRIVRDLGKGKEHVDRVMVTERMGKDPQVFGSTPTEHQFWLGTLASQRQLRLSEGKVELKRDSKVVAKILGE